MTSMNVDELQTSKKRKVNITSDTSHENKGSLVTTVQKCCGSIIVVTSGSVNSVPLCLLFLVPTSKLSFHGRAKLTVVGGPPVEILGAVIYADVNNIYGLYSPNSHASLVINQCSDKKVSLCEENLEPRLDQVLRARHSELCHNHIQNVLENEKMQLNDEISILLFETLDCRVTSSLLLTKRFNNIFSFNHLPFVPNPTAICESLGFAFSESYEDGGFHISHDMLAASDKVNALVPHPLASEVDPLCSELVRSSIHHCSICMVAGPKGVGKSSFIRFVLNRYLTNNFDNNCSTNRVAVLDCDIGQPEFTSCGMVSLTLISQPVFGPPFSHHANGVNKPIRQCFVGSVTPSDDPEFYINSLKYVFEGYTSLPDPKPLLLVNTMGWTQGLGITLLVEQVLMVRPRLIIQLQLQEHQPGFRQNLPLLDSDTLHGLEGWNHQSLSEETFEHETIIVPSPTFSRRGKRSSSAQLHSQWGAPDHRDLTMLAHLTASLADAETSLPARGPSNPLGHPVAHLLDCLPYRVPLLSGTTDGQQLAVRILQSTAKAFQDPTPVVVCDVDNLITCLNATLVGLCAVPQHLIETSPGPSGSLAVIRENPICECIGLAVCRAVDPSKKLLYLTTGLSESDLLRVTGIVRGSINLPQCYFLEQPVIPCKSNPPVPSQIPYLGPSETQGLGKAGLPSRRSYPRTKHHSVHRTGSYDQK